MTGSEPWRCALGHCFPVLPGCRSTLGYSVVPIGTRTYSFSGLAVMSVLVMYFFLFYDFLCSVNIGNIICAPHSYVQVCADAAVEDHCLVLSFGGFTV